MAKKKDEPATSTDDDKVTAGAGDMLEDQAEDALTDAPEEAVPTDDPVMAALFEERDSLKDQLLRALADVENMRRRTERELESARKYAHTGFARDLVGAIDNLSRAIDADCSSNGRFCKIFKLFNGCFADNLG